MRGVEVGLVRKIHLAFLSFPPEGGARNAARSADRLDWGLARTLPPSVAGLLRRTGALPCEEGCGGRISASSVEVRRNVTKT